MSLRIGSADSIKERLDFSLSLHPSFLSSTLSSSAPSFLLAKQPLSTQTRKAPLIGLLTCSCHYHTLQNTLASHLHLTFVALVRSHPPHYVVSYLRDKYLSAVSRSNRLLTKGTSLISHFIQTITFPLYSHRISEHKTSGRLCFITHTITYYQLKHSTCTQLSRSLILSTLSHVLPSESTPSHHPQLPRLIISILRFGRPVPNLENVLSRRSIRSKSLLASIIVGNLGKDLGLLSLLIPRGASKLILEIILVLDMFDSILSAQGMSLSNLLVDLNLELKVSSYTGSLSSL